MKSWKHLVTYVMLPLVMAFAGPAPLVLAQEANKPPAPPPPAMPKHIKTGPKSVKLFKPTLSFSTNPTDLELSTAHIFLEPLIPMETSHISGENEALATALTNYKAQKDRDDVTILTSYLLAYPDTRWRASLELNIGERKNESGHLSEAHSYFRSAWQEAQSQTQQAQKAVGDAALAKLCMLEARLGFVKELDKNLADSKHRAIHGTAEAEIRAATEGDWCMRNRPDIAHKCGPFALNTILNSTGKAPGRHPVLTKVKSTAEGTNLAQLKEWSDEVGLHYQMGKRGSNGTFIVPSVIHWKTGHFGAITAFKKGKYRLQDPTFGAASNLWVTADSLASETDGYFLVPPGQLPPGWTNVDQETGGTVWGKADAQTRDEGKTPTDPKKCLSGRCCSTGMAQAFVFSMQSVLNITDTPLGYSPPVGPDMNFRINYNFLEGNQPLSGFTFSNLGYDWSLNWISYLTLDSSLNATISVPGGGYEVYPYTLPDNVSNPYPPALTSQATLTVIGVNAYQRQLPDGTRQIFNQPDSTGRIFMTQIVDPQGNSAYIQYDSNFRVTSITDALGQVSTLAYVSNTIGNVGFYKISSITDPFGRSCTFTYDSTTTNLMSSADVIGIVSSFVYDVGSSFINTLTTPYGSTSFSVYAPSNSGPNLGAGLRTLLPDQSQIVIENWINETCQTYFWDREAMTLYPNDWQNQDHTHCEIIQWVLSNTAGPFVQEPAPDFVKPALDNQTNFLYQGATFDGLHWVFGANASDKPIQIKRLVSGTTSQTWSYQYNSRGKVTQATDPLGRIFSYLYAANDIDLLEIRQTQSGGNDLNGKWEYNAAHLADVCIDGSGQKTLFSYNSFGELQTRTDTLGNIWTLTYDPNGYLIQTSGPLLGTADVTTFAYDGYGRVYQITDSQGYTLTYSYDNADRVTQISYPDGTSDQTIYKNLDAVLLKDRIGRWTNTSYDSMDQLSYVTDPLGRKTQYSWCPCGSLSTLTDPKGNTTTWEHDLEGRVAEKLFQDSSNYQYAYDAIGRLSTRTDALGQVTTYGYNLDNTINQISYSNTVNPTSSVNVTYDPAYPRISTVQNGWGTIAYNYNAYVTDPYATATTGAGMIGSITNNVIANSTISYSYDALGRVTNRSVNGISDSESTTYDAINRVTAETNSLGTFNYSYVDDKSGASKGTAQLASVGYPSGQATTLSWYDNLRDQRLESINNLLPNGTPLSQFSYGYNSQGEITRWGQQIENRSPRVQDLEYDRAGQLISTQSHFGATPNRNADQFYFQYDQASNRSAVQTSSTETAVIKGTPTSGDVLTLTVNDPALGSGSESINYTVATGDSLSTIASKFAAAITADTNLQAIGVNAVASVNQILLRSNSTNPTNYSQSISGGATESISLGVSANAVQNATIGGTVSAGDVLTLTVFDAGISGGSTSVNYVVASSDTLNNIASGLASAVNGASSLTTAGITATATQNIVHLSSTSSNLTTYSRGLSSGATETIYLSLNMNGPQTILVGGSPTTGDVLGITAFDNTLSGGSELISYTVGSGDTLSSIASALASAINSSTDLQGIGVSAVSTGALLTIASVSTGITSYQTSRLNTATETLTQSLNPNGLQTATISGSKTTGDTLTITIYDAGLSGGSKAETYTVVAGDNLNTITAGLAALISGDSTLSALGISASATSTVMNLSSNSTNLTTYAKSTNSGATETITLCQSTGITNYSFNTLNELTSTNGGGAGRFKGTTNKPIKSATINSTVSAELPTTTSYVANPTLAVGNNPSTVSATDGNNNTVTNTFQIAVQAGPSASLTFDANGNMTSDGTNNYSYDAENRLIQITYPGTGNHSSLVYDGLGENTSILEYTSGSLTSTKQFVGPEERDASGSITKEFFDFGQIIGGVAYSCSFDHLGSIRELVNNSGVVQAQYAYTPFGESTKLNGSIDSDIQFADYYIHQRSGLSLTEARVYSPKLARFLNRDPIEEAGGINLFAYAENDPVGASDPSGLQCVTVVDNGRSTGPNGTNPGKPVPGPNIPWGTGYGWGSGSAGNDIPWYPGGGDPAAFYAHAEQQLLNAQANRQRIVELFAYEIVSLGSIGGARAGISVGTGAPGIGFNGGLPLKLVRHINRGESVAELLAELKELTWVNGVEHAIVKFPNGLRAIVSGGKEGIRWMPGQVKFVIVHTHVFGKESGPSGTDFLMLEKLGQKSSHVLEFGKLTKFWRIEK